METFEKLMLLYSRVHEQNSEPQEQPPASVFAINLAFAGLGLKLPPALEKLYTWHNGIFHLNGFLHFMPLREAVKIRRTYSERELRGSEAQIRANWFPVFDLNGDIQYCIDVQNQELWTVDLEDGSVRKLADNYELYLDALLAAFARGFSLFYPLAGSFKIKPNEWMALCREFKLEEPW